MFVFFILVFCLVQVLLAVHYSIVTSRKPNGNIVFGLSFPKEHINAPELTEIGDAFKRRCNLLLLFGFFALIPLYFMQDYISFATITMR